MSIKRVVCLGLALIITVLTFAEGDSLGGERKVVVISKSFQNQFYQVAFAGAEEAGKEFGFTVITNGPDAESNIPQQVEQVQAAINQRPFAIVLAACDPESVQDALTKAKKNGIPVIGLDSGVPGDASGAVVATAATDNYNAGAFVADNLADDAAFQAKIKAGIEANPAIVAVLAQDSTSGSIVFRVNGFVDRLKVRLDAMSELADAVSISGQTIWDVPSKKPAKAKIVVTVPPTTTQADIQTAATTMLRTPNTVALFAANQGAVDGLISATADGTELDRNNGRYKDLIVVGFDAGSTQKDAIRNRAFFGSVTQDPYRMGYESIRLIADVAAGKAVKDVDTGAKWYNYKNVDAPDIAPLLYD